MAKNEFLVAITQLAAEKNLPKEVVFEAVEAALASAYKRDDLATSDVVVKIDPDTGATSVFTRKTVVEEVEDEETQITLDEARKSNPLAQMEDGIDTEIAAQYSGRVAAQTAKQVVLQRLREAEREVVFEEYAGKEGDIASGEMVRMEGRNVIIDLGKAEALLPGSEQVRIEHYRSGQRLKYYILEVYKAAKGPQVVVSRTHKNLVRRLFELEVPEISKGIVEIKAIAREAGFRSKVAVWSDQEGVDPVGSCVGLRGIRIQNIVNELNGERIDIVLWNPEPSRFVAHALSPAQVVHVGLDEATNTAEVVVPDRQLSLAIGKEGQNARLAAKLSGWRIDIKGQAIYEEIMGGLPEAEEKVVEEAAAEETAEEAEGLEEAAVAETVEASEQPAAVAEAEEPAAEVTTVDEPVEAAKPEPAAPAAPQIRFAEEILVGDREQTEAPPKTKTWSKGKKSAGPARDTAVKAKRPKRSKRVILEEEDEEYEYESP
ncbi:MAG: transcription termination/antitermination protein NusA [Chloroflexi bacterium]|nr:transcription termination/antitermination protein NusA [Chloroflexota bacterium]